MPKSEVDVIKSIDEALGSVDESTANRVLQWAISKYGGQQAPANVTPPNSPPPNAPQSMGDIRTFVTLKKPQNFYQRVACIAYYLERKEGKKELKTVDFTKANDEGRLGRLSNAAQFVRDATRKYGFLASVGHGKVGLSPRGEAVVDALPDEARVKEALSSMPSNRKRKKKK